MIKMDNYELILKDYLLYLAVEKGLSDNTIESYRRDLVQFGDWLKKRNEKLSTMDQLLLREYQMFLGEHLKPTSMARKTTALKGFIAYLEETKVIKQTIQIVDRTKKTDHLPQVLTIEQMEALINIVPRDKLAGKRDAAILELMYATGMRVSEVIDLTLDRFYAEEQFIRVIGKGSKERLVPFGKCAKNAVAEYIVARQQAGVNPSPFVFLSNRQAPMTRQAVWKLIKKYAKLANIPFEVTPHTIRHTFATHLLNNGVDLRAIQEMLGHSDISTTQIYVHIAFNDIENQYHSMHPRSQNGFEKRGD